MENVILWSLEKQKREFNKCEDGVKLFGHRDLYSIYPVEYKKGKPKKSNEDILQLTAQTMCLEEMFSTRIEEGAIFYGETRRREQVYFSSELREEVENMFSEMHEYYKKNYTPKVKKTKACQSCSLKNLCLFPTSMSRRIVYLTILIF